MASSSSVAEVFFCQDGLMLHNMPTTRAICLGRVVLLIYWRQGRRPLNLF